MDTNSYGIGDLNRVTAIVIVLLCVTLVIVLISQTTENEVTPQEDSQSSLNQALEFDAFEEVLVKSERQELFELLESIQFRKSDSLPSRLEKSRQRIAVGNKILDASTDRDETDEANALLIEKILEYLQILSAEDIELDKDHVARLDMLVETVNSSSSLATQQAAALAKVRGR